MFQKWKSCVESEMDSLVDPASPVEKIEYEKEENMMEKMEKW